MDEENIVEKWCNLSILGKILLVLYFLFVIIAFFCLEGLIFWGVGCLVINVFGISYTWSFIKGLTVAIVIAALSCVTIRVNINNK